MNDEDHRRSKGLLLSFEGIDASGKNTQSRMIFDYLASEEGPAILSEHIAFPDYDTRIGQEIRAFLSGNKEYGLETRHLLYAANRYEKKNKIVRWLEEGKVIIANRYCESNLAYGVANGLPLEWLREVESQMPQSDFIFFLKATPQVSRSRKVHLRDRYEADLGFLQRVSEVYDALAEPVRWLTIDAERPRETVHYEISKLTLALIQDHSMDKVTR